MRRPATSASTTTALKAPLTVASGWLLGNNAGYTRAETASLPSSRRSFSQIASSLMVQSMSRAEAKSSGEILEIPSR